MIRNTRGDSARRQADSGRLNGAAAGADAGCNRTRPHFGNSFA